MDFHVVADAVEKVSYVDRWHARQLYDHVRETGAREVLELGTAHGGSASYLAAAVAANGGGRVTTVDRNAYIEPTPEETIARTGLGEHVDLIRTEYSSYAWWLKERIEERTTTAGECAPLYDFCLLDGAHDFYIDGVTVVLVERLLKPGGWLALDDLDWTYERVPRDWHPPLLSDAERAAPQVRAVFEQIVRALPAFTQLRIEDGVWGWAQKAPGQPRSLTVRETRVRRGILAQRAERAAKRCVARLRARG